MMRHQDVANFIRVALECSIYISPHDVGLTHAELIEAGSRLEFLEGELGDALQMMGLSHRIGHGRFLPQPAKIPQYFAYPLAPTPDFRNVHAFQFLHEELQQASRQFGRGGVRIDRSVLVNRGGAKGLKQHEIEVAVTVSVLIGSLRDDKGVLSLNGAGVSHLSPIEQANQSTGRGYSPTPDDTRTRIYGIVKDIIERRSDGRPTSAEPLHAFAEVLSLLGYAPFRLWWTQSVAELRSLDPLTTPVASAVAAASLVEGALTFVVKHARALGVGVLGSKTFDGAPRTWRIDDLVASASAGGASAILDQSTRYQAEALIKVRQRIHAGGMLSEYPQGVPDLRPEEAREAKATAEKVVRRVLDWLQRFPAKPA